MYLPRVIKKHIPGFDIIDIKDHFKKGFIEIQLKKADDQHDVLKENASFCYLEII